MDYYTDYVRAEEEKGRRYPGAAEVLDDLAFNSGMTFPFLGLLLGHKWLRRLAGAETDAPALLYHSIRKPVSLMPARFRREPVRAPH